MLFQTGGQVDWPTTRRVHIIGGPGSGKTTLAGQLAARLKTSAYNLDEVGYEGGNGPQRPPAARLAEVDRIAAGPDWVSEGVFLWWTERLLQAAEVIVWLDLPWPVAVRRIVTRHLKLSLAGTNPHPGLRRLLGFLGWSMRYYLSGPATLPVGAQEDAAVSRAVTATYLQPYAGKVIHCRRPDDFRF